MILILHLVFSYFGEKQGRKERLPLADNLTIPQAPRLAQRIRRAAERGALGQAVILSGQGDLLQAARFVAAAMECQGEDPPCGHCGPCRKVLRDIHPDVITVTDPEHKNISMDVLRSVRSDAYILPNEGKRKIYLFPDCALLDPKVQNVLLKVLEEGPPHAAFLFCAQNSAALLPTIRSRSVEWKLDGGEERAPADADAEQLCRLLCAGKRADLVAFCAQLENGKIKREELQGLLSDTRDLLSGALAACYGAGAGEELSLRLAEAMGPRRLSAVIEIVETFTRQCGYNIGVGHLTGALAVALTE